MGAVRAHLLGLDCHATLDAPHGGSITPEYSLLILDQHIRYIPWHLPVAAATSCQ